MMNLGRAEPLSPFLKFKKMIMKKIKIVLIGMVLMLAGGQASAYEFDDWNEGDDAEIAIEENEVAGTMEMQGNFLDGDLLELTVKAKDLVSPILGISFHLKFDAEKMGLLRYEPGNFLERGGDPFYLVQVVESEIVFGETLRREDSFPFGEGEVVRFYFQILEGDEFKFEFENGVISTLDTVRQDLGNVQWQNLDLNKNGGGVLAMFQNSSLAAGKKSFYPAIAVSVILAGATFFFIIRRSNKRLVNFK